MNPEQQVCSLELAKRLKELGVKQESIFWHWATDVEQDGLTWWTVSEKEPRRGKKVRELSTPGHYRGKISAFTAAELGEMLPKTIKKLDVRGVPQKSDYYLNISWSEPDKKWRYTYSNPTYNACVEMWFETTEADARAKMLIYLLENKLFAV